MNDKRRNYPRPQLMRDEWIDLDGQWNFKFDDVNQGEKERWFESTLEETQVINVPFTYETIASGIHDEIQHPIVWYQNTVQLDDLDYVLNFEASDYITSVWLNGFKLGDHIGGYTRFSFDLHDYAVIGDNVITVKVTDSLSTNQPRGKQRWLKDNFGCWYVQTTGIWKSVWIEKAKQTRVNQVKLVADLPKDQINITLDLNQNLLNLLEKEELTVKLEASIENQIADSVKLPLTREMKTYVLDTKVGIDDTWGTRVWHPYHPNLYDLTVTITDEQDEVIDHFVSCFGMRTIEVQGDQVIINKRGLYQRLVLDQGYWPESGLTPPSVEALELDIQRTKELGYNGLRKHQKIEDERFLYLCDKNGMLVWSEMPSHYSFSDKSVEAVTDEWIRIIRQFQNHPSIITWVPFNESWGIKNIQDDKEQQAFVNGIYYLTKAIDPTRLVVTNDGWEHTISDVITLHDYDAVGEELLARYSNKDAIVNNQVQFNKDWYAFAKGYNYQGQPVIISEFGGIAFEDGSGWGYGEKMSDEESFMERFDAIHLAIQKIPYVSGYCYTQLTDVEQEVNGLLFTNREFKLPVEPIKKINERRTR
ncbi:glycoside hydrolase family 2 protein [Fundicoccus culcitae]|uniref:Glycoside hydrolase family 2 n=1 Tax=Fundicoccus culcitae TaxID=2969821 RepID=A0ABY5PA11_9LACT|nr:sugar-binding domain-containing protein [Fundicoccus culcitae]UUX35384.1 glycoside hydrolase family 2 [Fundicoccus culcitae]